MSKMTGVPLLLACVLSLSACGDRSSAPAPVSQEGSWTKIPSAPLAARRSPHVHELGGRLLVAGGTGADPCPPLADCEAPSEPSFTDGAMYDPATGDWQPIADSPLPLGVGSSVVADGKLYVLLFGVASSHPSERPGFLSYDPDADRWTQLEMPPGETWRSLIGTPRGVIAAQTSQEHGIDGDFAFDPASRSWSKLPRDPLAPAYDRSVVFTDSGLVVLGIELVPNPGVRPPFYEAAVLRDGRWERLPDSRIIGWDPVWVEAGGLVVNATIESADGGETNGWGRSFPGGGMLDPGRGEWLPLPDVPDARGEFDGLYASGHERISSGNGWVFHVASGRWTELTSPPTGARHETGGAWIGHRLFVWGGVIREDDDPSEAGSLADEGWVWQPPEA